MADYEEVYDAFFSECLNVLKPLIEGQREQAGFRQRIAWEVESDVHLFNPMDEESLVYAYSHIVGVVQREMSIHLEGLVRSMLDSQGREHTLGTPFGYKCGYWRRIPIVLYCEGHKVAILFTENRPHPELPRVQDYDKLLVVVAARTPQGVCASTRTTEIECICVKELFDLLFPNEYERFLAHVDRFNEEVRNMIAFTLIEQPTIKRMPAIKAACVERLREDVEGMRNGLLSGDCLHDNCDQSTTADIVLGPDQVEKLYARFLGEGICNALVGECDFAESYISSEWLYQMNRITQTLEQTGTAVGYIKSIEQLLFSVAALFKDKAYAMSWRDKDGVSRREPWDKKFANPEKVSLWSLIDFFSESNNIGLLCLDPPFDGVLQSTLHEFRKEYRNKYLHKANLIGEEGLKDLNVLRKKVELIYLLVLGGCSITEDQYPAIGLEKTPNTHSDILSEWAVKAVRTQAFRRDMKFADRVVLQLTIDSSQRDAPRALYYEEGDFWKIKLELHYGQERCNSSSLDQPYEIALTLNEHETWKALAIKAKLSVENAIEEAVSAGVLSSALPVSTMYYHLDGNCICDHYVYGPKGETREEIRVAQVIEELSGNSFAQKRKR